MVEPSPPSASVVVLNYNGRHLIEPCLEATVAQARSLGAEVVFVDNASTDASVDFVRDRFPDVRVVENATNEWFAGGCNAGVRASRSDRVVLLNNDAVPEPGWLERLLAAVEPPDVAIACSVVRDSSFPDEYALGTGSISVIGHPIPGAFRDLDHPFYATGCSLVFKRELIGEPFPEVFFAYFEDTVLSWRARLRGFRVTRALDSVVQHLGSATASRMPGRALFFYERNKLLMLLLCYERGTLLRLGPLYAFDAVTRLVRDLWLAAKTTQGQPAALGALVRRYAIIARAVAWLPAHRSELTALRREVQRERQVRDAEITPMLSGKIFDDVRSTRMQRFANLIALAYCRFVGIRTSEGLQLEGADR